MSTYRTLCCTKLKVAAADFRTSTGVGHQHILPRSEHYEHNRRYAPKQCVQKPEPFLEMYKTTTSREHGWKIGDKDFQSLPRNNRNVNYMINLQEKNVKYPQRPPQIGACGTSEYKENYPRKSAYVPLETVVAVEPAYICKSISLGRDERPPIPAASTGVLKLLDPYVSTYQMAFIPFTREQQLGVAKKDIDTFYDIIGLPKCKGFGPKQCSFVGPLLSIRKEPIYDSVQFQKMAKNRDVPMFVRRVPFVGMESEHQCSYRLPVDDLSSHIWDSGVEYAQPYPRASPWENLAAPYMYCREGCHVGSKKFPVRAVVDPGRNTKNAKMC